MTTNQMCLVAVFGIMSELFMRYYSKNYKNIIVDIEIHNTSWNFLFLFPIFFSRELTR